MTARSFTSIFAFVISALFHPLLAAASAPAGTVPEPLSLALVATGVAGLGAVELIRRRKKK